LSVAAATPGLITHQCSETRSLDLTNNGMGNHYLTDVCNGDSERVEERSCGFRVEKTRSQVQLQLRDTSSSR
jgi:hypothetical protein